MQLNLPLAREPTWKRSTPPLLLFKLTIVRFLTHMDTVIQGNLTRANLGGRPGMLEKINAFLNVTLWKADLLINENIEVIQDVPIWAGVFYALRCGLNKVALDYVTHYRNLFEYDEQEFPQFFQAYIDNEFKWVSLNFLRCVC